MVENTGFRNIIYTLEPRYTIPPRRFFSDSALPKIYNEVETEVKESLSKAERVALKCDVWMSRATESYVTVTVHHITQGSSIQVLCPDVWRAAMRNTHLGTCLWFNIFESIDFHTNHMRGTQTTSRAGPGITV